MQGLDVNCSNYAAGIIDGNFVNPPPTQITIDQDCQIINFQPPNVLSSNINFVNEQQNPEKFLIVFDSVVHTGTMACNTVAGHTLWFTNGSSTRIQEGCQNLIIPVEKLDKRNPAGPATARVGEPFTYTLTTPVMYDPATGTSFDNPSLNDLGQIRLTDDLTAAATGAELTLVAMNAYYKGSGAPVPVTNQGDDKHLIFDLPDIPKGQQIVVELTVVLDDVPANTAGTQFVNIAKWWFSRHIDVDKDGVLEPEELYAPLPGEWGRTLPMTIVEPSLVVTKSGPDLLGGLNLGQRGEFTIDVHNTGTGDAWNVTLLDLLPDGAAGGMCDMTPQVLSARIFAADGVTPISGLLTQGTDFSFSYTGPSGTPACQLDLTMLSEAARLGPDQRLKIVYQSKLDPDSTINGVQLTNIAGATRWFSAESGHAGRRTYTRPLTDGTVGTLDHQDAHNVMVALSGLFFEKSVENRTTGKRPATVAAPGDTLRYTLRLFSLDNAEFAGLSFYDDLGALNPSAVFVPGSLTLISAPPGADIRNLPFGGTNGAGILDIRSLNIPSGGEITVTFDITLASTLTHGDIVLNQAELIRGGDRITVSDDPNIDGQANPDPAVVDEDPTRVLIQTPQPPLKSIVPLKSQATIGEEVVYQITVPATPYADVLNNVVVHDTLDPALIFVSAKIGGTPLANTGTAPQVILPIGTIGAGQQVVITLTARVADRSEVSAGHTFTNAASYSYAGVESGQGAATPAITVVEPEILPAKSVTPAPPATPTVGDILTYTITLPALAGANHSPAFDVFAIDTLSLGLRYIAGTARINAVAAPDPVLGGGDGITAPQSLAWTGFDLPRDATVILTYQVEVLGSVIASQRLGNSVAVQWTSLDGDIDGERTYTATAAAPELTTPPDGTTIAKSRLSDTYNAADPSLRVGDLVDYELRIGLQKGTHTGLVLTDTLPAEMAFAAMVSADFFGTPGTATPVVNGQTLTWDLGTLVNPGGGDPASDDLVIVYRARVLNGDALVQQESTPLTNRAALDYLVGGVPATQLTASETVTVLQPVLTVTKSAAPAGGDAEIAAGETVVYTVDIVNSGAAPAYDTVLVDTLPPGLRRGGVATISVTLVAAGTTLPVPAPTYDADSGVATWNFDSDTADAYTIPAGETLRLVCRAVADADLGAGLTLTNAAAATLYHSFDDEDIPPGGALADRQSYGPSNTAVAALASPVPGVLLKENTQPTAAIGEQFRYRITVPGAPVNAALHDVRILDDLGASAADLRFVSVAKISGPGSWNPVNTGSETSLVIVGTDGGIDLPPGGQAVIEVTVELLETPTNTVGLNFTNTADYTYNQIADSPASQTSGLPGTTEPMQIVGLAARKTVAIDLDQNSNGLLDPGDVLIYTITVDNPGSLPATGTLLTDDLPTDTSHVAGSVTLNGESGAWQLASGMAIGSEGSLSGTIAPRSSAVVTFKVRVDDDVPAGTVISNQGYVTSDQIPTLPTDADGNAANGYQPTTIVVGSDQQVRISKEVSVVGGGAVLPGSELEYVVRVANTGPIPVTGLVITDNLALLQNQAAYVAGSATLNGAAAGVSYAASMLTADFASIYGNLPPASTATLRFRVLVAGGLAAGTRLTNTAQMAWNTPTLTALASASVDIGGVLGSAMLNGQLWHDADLDKLYDVGETNLAGWTAALYRHNVQIASAVSDADGFYVFSGIEPTLTVAGQYELRFTAPGAGPDTAMLGYADSPFRNGPQRISGISVASGGNLQNLDLPLSPNGVVYNTVLRSPVAGARVALLNTATDTRLPEGCFDDPAQQSQVTALDGFYKFDLNFSDPSCPPGGDYRIEVTPPATGYVGMPSRIIPPNGEPSAPFSVPACAGNAGNGDALPATAEYCEVTASAAVPSAPPRTGGTVYHLHLTLSDGLVPGQSQVFNNHIPVDPELGDAVFIAKSASLLNVSRGELVPYRIVVRNSLGQPLYDIGIVDRFPAGFKYVPGSARLDGKPFEPRGSGRELVWDGLRLEANDGSESNTRELTLLLVVGSGVSEGEYVNRAQAINTASGRSVSGEATATVRVIPDPTFDCTDVIGKVFDDRNLDGKQDAGEDGVSGVRVATARGLVATTDEHGRFHLTCVEVPDENRGSNFILKLDDRSLPTGYRLTTENPRVQRATRGKLLRFNFGATIHRVVGIDLAAGAFEPEAAGLRPQWTPRIALLLEELKKGPAVLRLSYLADVESERVVRDRLKALKKEIAGEWTRAGGGYRLDIETEVFWRRGGPP